MKKRLHITRRKIEYNKIRNKNLVVWGAIVVLIIIAFLIFNFLLLPQIKLNGDRKIILSYNEKYFDKGYDASFLGEDITDSVKVSGKVNSKKLGKYKIVYEVKKGVFKRKVTRVIEVKDIKGPKIEVSNDDLYVCPEEKVEAYKVKAIDNYDGDVSKNVSVKVKKDKIIYRVEDKSGNKTEVIRKIFYKDISKPEIKLNGSEHMYIYVNDEFIEPGYDVFDNCNKNLKEKVKVTGKVNTNEVGEYKLTYTVTDSSNNKSVMKRVVHVSERAQNGTVYLTFDDGPNRGTTDVILDILKEEGVKATFFVTSRGPDDLIKRMYDEGHSVALHTSSHNYAEVYSSIDNYFGDLLNIQARVKRITGYESKIIRFPGGSSNTISRKYALGIMSNLTTEVVNRGFKYYDWNINSGDAEGGYHTADEIYNNVTRSLRKDRVNMVLMHDIKTHTRDAIRNIIRYCKDNGYPMDAILMDTEMIKQRVNN